MIYECITCEMHNIFLCLYTARHASMEWVIQGDEERTHGISIKNERDVLCDSDFVCDAEMCISYRESTMYSSFKSDTHVVWGMCEQAKPVKAFLPE